MSLKGKRKDPHIPRLISPLSCVTEPFLPMKDAQRQRRRKTDRCGGESQDERVERQTGRKGKHARQSKKKKGKSKARQGDWEKKMIMIA